MSSHRGMPLMAMLAIVAVVFAVNLASSSAQTIVGRINGVNNPSLLNVFKHKNGKIKTTYSILVSTFDANRNTYDNAYLLQYPGEALSREFTDYKPRLIFNQLYGPKEIQQVPCEVFSYSAITIPDGTTISGKTSGTLRVTDIKDLSFPRTHDLLEGALPSKTPYMYSNAVWLQADTGLSYDIITCRVRYEAGILKEAQLVLLQQPLINERDSKWSLSVIKESACDSKVALTSFNLKGIGNKYDVIYATGSYMKRLAFFYTTSHLSLWTDPRDIKGVVLEQGREFYDVKVLDLNNDGKQDILTTVVDRSNGAVEVWEVPKDFRHANEYTRHVIAKGFSARTGGAEGRSPGVAVPFYPTSNTKVKPWIAVSGADDGRAYVLSPWSENSFDWSYVTKTIADYGPGQIVSGITAADVDGDGFTELFISVRAKNTIEVFTYHPASQPRHHKRMKNNKNPKPHSG